MITANETPATASTAPGRGRHGGVDVLKTICTVPDCDRPGRARGWCSTHWWRWRKYGDPLTLTRTRRTCTQGDCDGLVEGHGFCPKHYRRWRRYGSPDGFAHRPDVVERLWAKLQRSDDPAACWVWTGGRTVGGYGVLWPSNRKMVYTHRLAWETLRGPIPAGLQIDHLCRNTLCANPEHLEPVTPAENLRRAAVANKDKPRPHSNRHSYGTGCRCDECKAANTAACAAYRHRRRERLAIRAQLEAGTA